MGCEAWRTAGRKGSLPETRAVARRLVISRRCSPRPTRPAGLLYVGTLLSWTRVEEPFAATLQIIVPAAERGHVRPVVDHPS